MLACTASSRMSSWVLRRAVSAFRTEIRALLLPESAEAGPWRREIWNSTRDGRRIPVRLISDTVRDEQGRPVGRVTVCEDLSEVVEIRASIARRDRILEAVGFAAVQLLSDRPWQATLREVLAALGRATEARIARFDLVFAAGDLAPVSIEWRAADPLHPPVEPEPGQRRRDLLAALRGTFEVEGTLRSSSGEIPQEFLREMDATDSGSAVLLPVALGSETQGVLTLESSIERREFEAAELEALRVAGRTLAAALHGERSRRALETTENEYRRLLDEASDLVLAIEPEGRLLFVNKAARRVLDLDESAAEERRFWDILPPEARDTSASCSLASSPAANPRRSTQSSWLPTGGGSRWRGESTPSSRPAGRSLHWRFSVTSPSGAVSSR